MKYIDVRNQIKSGDILAWSHGGWSSWYDIQVSIVRMFTQSEYSHVGIAWVIGGRVFIIEAVGSGVRIFPLSREIPFYWIPQGEADYWNDAVEEHMLSRIGDKYSKWDAILAFFGKLNIGSNNSWQCAELTIDYMKFVGMLVIDIDATPSAVVNYLLDSGYNIHKVI